LTRIRGSGILLGRKDKRECRISKYEMVRQAHHPEQTCPERSRGSRGTNSNDQNIKFKMRFEEDENAGIDIG
jgi:hypothetical protein